jgi:predicted TIM-barrel fold metal-dependent hydrolase
LRALLADTDNARAFILRFEDRLLFGRDYYGAELFAFLTSLDLPDSTWRKLGRDNAEKLLAATQGVNSSPVRPLIRPDA